MKRKKRPYKKSMKFYKALRVRREKGRRVDPPVDPITNEMADLFLRGCDKINETAAPSYPMGFQDPHAKKGPVLAIRLVSGELLQFPMERAYEPRTINGEAFFVVTASDGPFAFIKQGQIAYICHGQYLFRDGDGK